jgi:hypothetical protein
MSGDMSAHVNLIRHMQIYAPSYTPGAYLVHKTHLDFQCVGKHKICALLIDGFFMQLFPLTYF